MDAPNLNIKFCSLFLGRKNGGLRYQAFLVASDNIDAATRESDNISF
jgi:hypothetical protein